MLVKFLTSYMPIRHTMSVLCLFSLYLHVSGGHMYVIWCHMVICSLSVLSPAFYWLGSHTSRRSNSHMSHNHLSRNRWSENNFCLMGCHTSRMLSSHKSKSHTSLCGWSETTENNFCLMNCHTSHISTGHTSIANRSHSCLSHSY